MSLRHIVFSILLLATFSISVQAGVPDSDEVWRIGTFDGSSAEFADGAASQPIVYVIGRDEPKKSWYSFAPALFPSGKVTPTNAPRTIQFEIKDNASSSFRLRVSLLIENPSVPALQTTINGHKGLFYLHPKLDYNIGDTIAAFFPAYSHALVEFDIPRGLIHGGTNTIALQAVATATEGVPDAGFTYDAIELDRVHAPLPGIAAHAEPTIFYERSGETLLEQVAIFVRYAERPRNGSMDFEIAGKHYKN